MTQSPVANQSVNTVYQTRERVFNHTCKHGPRRDDFQGVWNVMKHSLECLIYDCSQSKIKLKSYKWRNKIMNQKTKLLGTPGLPSNCVLPNKVIIIIFKIFSNYSYKDRHLCYGFHC